MIWSRKNQSPKRLAEDFNWYCSIFFLPILGLIWSKRIIQVLVKCRDQGKRTVLAREKGRYWPRKKWQYRPVVGDTQSHPMFQTWSALTQPFVTTGFYLLQVGLHGHEEKSQSELGYVEIVAPGGSKMTIPQGLTNHHGAAPLKDLVLQGISARLGKKIKTQILLSPPPFIYTVTYSYRQLPRFASTERDTTLSILISHQALFFLWVNTSTDLLSSIILTQKYLKITGAASRQ